MDVRECTKEWKKLKDFGGGGDHNKEWRPRSEFLSAGTAYKMLGHDHKVTHNAPHYRLYKDSQQKSKSGLNQDLWSSRSSRFADGLLSDGGSAQSCTAGLWATPACAVGFSTSCAEVRSFNIQRGEVKSGVRNNKKCPLQPLLCISWCIFLIFKGFWQFCCLFFI